MPRQRDGTGMNDATVTFDSLAEDTLLVRFGDRIDEKTNVRVHRMAHRVRNAALPGIVDIAPAYASLAFRFDPATWRNGSDALPHANLIECLRGIIATADSPDARMGDSTERSAGSTARCPGADGPVAIPVCYGGEYGPDLDSVAAHAGLSAQDVIARHTTGEYTVAMLGFAPGFPYLLGLDDALHAPRLAMPRTRVPAGSVAIGGAQTGIYPRELPGGWNLLGRTPLVLFDPSREPPCLLTPGQAVRFRAIDAGEFARLSAGRAR